MPFPRPILPFFSLALALAASQACTIVVEPFPEGSSADAEVAADLDGAIAPGLDSSVAPGPDGSVPARDGAQPPGPDATVLPGRDAAQPPGPDAAAPPGPDAAAPPGPDAATPPGPDAATGECSGHGVLRTWGTVKVCECDTGYTGDPDAITTCVATTSLCAGAAFSYDWNNDGTAEASFDPTADECEMYELINRTRAGHDAEGTPECHEPLRYSLEWSAHARNHSKQMSDRGSLFHADYPMAQNCAYGCGPACEMNMYMTGANEGHCSPLSHHCNIMRCGTSYAGIGYWPMNGGNWNTQNFY